MSHEDEGWLEGGIREVLIRPEEIAARVQELGRQISLDYAGRELVMIGVLKGVLFFMADLLRCVTVPVEVDFLAVSSYSHKNDRQGGVRLLKDLEISIEGRHVLFVEDMVDTGLTLNYLLRNLQARQPASLEVCAFLNKSKNRLMEIPLKYRGFDVPDRFVVGYGLDYREQYRNLPFIGLLKGDRL